jgi:hypothetical protein
LQDLQILPPSSTVYLWGVDVLLLLKANFLHYPHTYYSHNHLFYWSSLKDPLQYAVDFIKQNQPPYVIEAGVISKKFFPEHRFKKEYSLLVESHQIRIFKLKRNS